MSIALASMAAELAPRHTAKWFARVLGVSIRSGKRYAAHPELFPRTRAEDLLAALEDEQARYEQRAAERRERLEALKREINAHVGLADPRLSLPRDRLAGRAMGRAVEPGRRPLSTDGRP